MNRPTYETLLARAEAAEKNLAHTEDLLSSCAESVDHWETECEAAESRMAAAVELLRRIVKYAREDRMRTPGVTRLARVLADVELDFLRSTPAPAATAPFCKNCGCARGQCVCGTCGECAKPAPAAESEPYRREPRTADGRTLFQVDYNLNADGTVRVHPDTALARALESRITELEAANKSLAEMTLSDKTRMAQAVAELEQTRTTHAGTIVYPKDCVERALAILKGERT